MAKSKIYNISSGICFMINLQYDDESEICMKNIKEKFEQLNFDIKLYNEFNDIQIFNNLNEMCKYKDAFVLYIKSYGTEGNIITSNKNKIKKADIIKLFTDQNCPDLIGKPKILIFDCYTSDNHSELFY